MTVTLRISGDSSHGEPVGAGFVAYYHHKDEPRGIKNGSRFEVDNWSEGTCKVYARPPGHTPPAPLVEFCPSELGLYIGHERGQPISAIKWASGAPDPSIKAAWVADAYRKARERARECPDPLLARALGNGVQDFMLQIMKLVGAGAPAMDELLRALASERPGLNSTTEELEADDAPAHEA